MRGKAKRHPGLPGRGAVRNMALSFSAAIDARCEGARYHSLRVSAIAVALATELGVRKALVEDIEIGGLLHDVGRLWVSEEVLNYSGPFNREHYWEMRGHPEHGASIISGARLPGGVRDAALFHHERYDGLGYPGGLAGTAIPFIARLIAVCDALEAMLSDRPHRRSLGFTSAMHEIREGAGSQFDPEVSLAATMLEPGFLRELLKVEGMPEVRPGRPGGDEDYPDVLIP